MQQLLKTMPDCAGGGGPAVTCVSFSLWRQLTFCLPSPNQQLGFRHSLNWWEPCSSVKQWPTSEVVTTQTHGISREKNHPTSPPTGTIKLFLYWPPGGSVHLHSMTTHAAVQALSFKIFFPLMIACFGTQEQGGEVHHSEANINTLPILSAA